MKRIILLFLFLTSCSQGSLDDAVCRFTGGACVVAGNETMLVIQSTIPLLDKIEDGSEIQKTAQKHCEKFNRKELLMSNEFKIGVGRTIIYNCVNQKD